MTHARMWVGTVVMVGLLGVLALSGSQDREVGMAGADSAVKKVKCDKGQTLTEALRKAKPGDMLQVTGTCHKRVTITGGLSVQNNDTGLLADGADTLTLASIPTNPSVVEHNGTNVNLKFGTRATFEGGTIGGTITCDATVLSRGTTECP